jgi:hypothetical protein
MAASTVPPKDGMLEAVRIRGGQRLGRGAPFDLLLEQRVTAARYFRRREDCLQANRWLSGIVRRTRRDASRSWLERVGRNASSAAPTEERRACV